MSTQAPQILGFIRYADRNSPANTRFAQQRCNWSQVGIIQQSTMGTNTDEIFRLNLNTPLTAQNAINIFGLSTDSSPEQLAKLQQSDLFNSFWNVNQGTPYIDDPRDVLIPGKESIHGREVFTLYDDGNPTTKLFGNSNGKMRYFDAQTGKELYTWLPEDVNIRDTEKARTATLQMYENSRVRSVADKLDILNFYVFNKCNNLSSRELNMILKIERELRGHDFKFEYPGYTEGDSNQSNQINTYIINILNEALNKLAEQRGEYLRAERPIPKELSDKINEYSTNLCHRELYMAQKNDPENDYVILEVNNSEVKEVYNSRQN